MQNSIFLFDSLYIVFAVYIQCAAVLKSVIHCLSEIRTLKCNCVSLYDLFKIQLNQII
jgi:hypothetical protein